MTATHQRLYINVDHVATIRQARRADEPDPVRRWRASAREPTASPRIFVRIAVISRTPTSSAYHAN